MSYKPHHHHHQSQPGGGYGAPPGPPPGFPSAPQGFNSPGYGGGFSPPPGPPPGQYGGGQQYSRGGYEPSYAPPPGPPSGQYGGGYGGGYDNNQGSGGYGGGYGYNDPGQGGYGNGNGYNAGERSYDGYGPPQGPPPPNWGAYPSAGGQSHMPPSEVQGFGPHFQGANQEDMQMSFQYSMCTGRKKALCIGINYIGTSQELRGCINDAQNIKRFLLTRGYQQDDIVMLTDDSANPVEWPTKQNIIRAMQWLVESAQPNDSLFFHYSGHGGQTKDLDGDEADGYDEVIYPVDHQQEGHIVDDDLFMIMVAPLPAGCRLTAIFDSCHSGSVLDLPYIYSTEGKIKEPNIAAEVGQGLFGMAKSYAQKDMGGVFKGAMGLLKTATGKTQKAEEYSRRTRTSAADAISWSGCKDSQTSADTVEAGSATGAMSYAFIECMTAKPEQTYQELLVNVRGILKTKYSQKPQLSSSHPIDTNIFFLI